MLPGIGGFEYLLIAILALVVIGPKDLPMLMRKAGAFVNRLRGMASEFRASFDEMARQSELEELRKEVEAMRAERLDPVRMTEEHFGYEAPVMRPLGQDPEPEFDAAAAHAAAIEAHTAEAPVAEPPHLEEAEPTLFDLDPPASETRT